MPDLGLLVLRGGGYRYDFWLPGQDHGRTKRTVENAQEAADHFRRVTRALDREEEGLPYSSTKVCGTRGLKIVSLLIGRRSIEVIRYLEGQEAIDE